MRPGMIIALPAVLLSLASMPSARPAQADLDPLDLDSIDLPPGFHISFFAEGLHGVRSLAAGPSGAIFAGTLAEGKVYAVRDLNGDREADEVLTVDEGLNLPSGVAFRGGDLYVAEAGRILIYPGIEDYLYEPPDPIVISNAFPPDRFRGWKTIAFGPDGNLYIAIGAPCNSCEPDDPRFATIARMNRDGESFEIYSGGVRSAGGLAWHPEGGDLFFTDAGHDWLGDDFLPDELNRAAAGGLHFGFPYCRGAGVPDPELGRGNCAGFQSPALELDPGVGAFGISFYDGGPFPESYRNCLFIAERGILSRSEPAGFRVMVVRFPGSGAPVYEEFAGGWLRDGKVIGRPTDILVTPEGEILLSDEYAGVIYRIWYSGEGQ